MRGMAKNLDDSQSGIHLAKNKMYHERTKHIDVKLHFAREIIERGDICLETIDTADNPADKLTKALPGPNFMYFQTLLNVVNM